VTRVLFYRDDEQAHLQINCQIPCTVWGQTTEVVDKNLKLMGWRRCSAWKRYKYGRQALVCKVK